MSKRLPPSRTAPQFVIRFPDEELREHIRHAAETNNRSMNAEIIARLQASFATAETQPARKPVKTPSEIVGGLVIADEDQADRVADKVVSKLMSTEGFMRSVQQALRIIEEGSGVDRKPIPTEPRTPTVPGVNAPKGGPKSPKG